MTAVMPEEFPDDRKAWEQWKGEPKLWFYRFTKYRRMGLSRSLLGVYRLEKQAEQDTPAHIRKPDRRATKREPEELMSCPSSWDKYPIRWQWNARAEAWDEHMFELQEREWQQRMLDMREESWGLYQTMLERVKEMLSYPLTEAVTMDDEGRTVIIRPVKWSLRDVQSLMATATKLGVFGVSGSMSERTHSQGGMGNDLGIPIPVDAQDVTSVGTPSRMLSEDEITGLQDKQLITHLLEQVK